MPVVAQTVACLGERPRANAFGMFVWAMATLGFGMSAWMQSRSIIACSSGASCGETSRAPIARSPSASEEKYCSAKSAATPTTTRAMFSPEYTRAPISAR